MRSGNKNKGELHNRYKHGMTGTSTYRSWAAMKARCYRKSCADYKNYGARGINVCEKWNTFVGFLADMGVKPSDDLTLERVDTNNGYSKENCIWADRTAQCRNRNYVKLSLEKAQEIRELRKNGETITSIAKKFGIAHSHVSRVHLGTAWKPA